MVGSLSGVWPSGLCPFLSFYVVAVGCWLDLRIVSAKVMSIEVQISLGVGRDLLFSNK